MMGGKRGASSGYILDPLLVPRIEQYAHNNSISNIDTTVDYLRRSYREYQRKQLHPFKKSVSHAVRIVTQKMRETDDGVDERVEVDEDEAGLSLSSRRRRSRKARDDLESKEEEHLRRRGYVQVDGSDSDSDEDEKSSSRLNGAVVLSASKTSTSDSSDDEATQVEKRKPSYNLLNSALTATYSNRPALVIQSPTFNGTSVFGDLQVESAKPQADGETPKQSFVSPEVMTSRVAKLKKPAILRATGETNTGKKELKKRGRENPSEASGKKGKTSGTIEVKEPAQNVRFKDFGGLDAAIKQVVWFIYPVLHPFLLKELGYEPMRGMLLHGPPGCGKTMLAQAIANEAGMPFFKISAPEVVSGTSGESEAKLRTLFAEASRVSPSILFIDEIDAISSKRESAHKEMERRIVTQLMVCMDDIGHGMDSDGDDDEKPKCVLVIGATNRPDSLDPALRRRFEREVCLGIPDEKARLQILEVLTKKLKVEGGFDFKEIARRTPGYVGADLKALTKEASTLAIERITDSRSSLSSHNDDAETPWWKVPWTSAELKSVSVTMQDFENAIKRMQPSLKREGFTEIPKVTWDDVGSLESVRDELNFSICNFVKNPDDYEALNFTDTGFLLYGPPGCGKTLVAKAVANAAGANFIYIKAGELFNKYVGESERAVRQLFSRARTCSPCLIFFDEVDALAPSRGNEANAATDRVVNQLLVEMDGLDQRKGIFLIAATNRPNMVDPALLRPGRLGKRIYIPLPDTAGRISILEALLRRYPLSSDIDIPSLAQHELCKNFTGADLCGLVQEACGIALRERWQNSAAKPAEKISLTQKHFVDALHRVKPSVAEEYEGEGLSVRSLQDGKRRRLVTHCPSAV